MIFTARYQKTLFVASALVAAALAAGCAPQKKLVDPYASQARREASTAKDRGGPSDIRPVRPAAPVDQAVPAQDDQNLLLPVLTMVNDRIYAYERKLAQWDAMEAKLGDMQLKQEDRDQLAACQQQLRAMLVEYNALHQRLLQRESIDAAMLLAGDSLLQLSSKDIALLEGDCAGLAKDPSSFAATLTPSGGSLHTSEAALKEAAAQGNYGQVVELYNSLPLEPEQKASFDARYQYGQALLRTGREAEARNTFAELLDDIRQQDQAQWEFRLLQLIGDLEFGLGLYDAAKEEYGAIANAYAEMGQTNEWARQQLAALTATGAQREELEAYATLLFSYLTYNPDRDGYSVVEKGEAFIAKYPYSPVASNADALIERARKDAETWLGNVLKQVDALTAEQRYQEALLLLERVPASILPPDKQEMLKRRAGEVTTAESIAIETDRMVKEQNLQEDWNKAMTHLEAREYDLAIEKFNGLVGTSYDAKARERISEAVELAASDDRRRAAELFVRAGRSPDVETKKKLLFASRQLLQDILVKYPQSELIDKVNRNLSRIEEEINALDPTLLTTPTTLDGRPAGTGAGTAEPPAAENGSRF